MQGQVARASCPVKVVVKGVVLVLGPLQVAVADACHANDYCGPLDQIGLREMIEEDRR